MIVANVVNLQLGLVLCCWCLTLWQISMVVPILNGAPKWFCKKGVNLEGLRENFVSGHSSTINPLNYWHKKLTSGQDQWINVHGLSGRHSQKSALPKRPIQQTFVRFQRVLKVQNNIFRNHHAWIWWRSSSWGTKSNTSISDGGLCGQETERQKARVVLHL